MSAASPAILLSRLKLTDRVRKLLEKPCGDARFPLHPKDVKTPVVSYSYYYCEADPGNVALLNVDEELFGSDEGRQTVAFLGPLFTEKCAAMFLFTEARKLDEEYRGTLSALFQYWRNSKPGLLDVDIFNLTDIEAMEAEPYRVTRHLKLDAAGRFKPPSPLSIDDFSEKDTERVVSLLKQWINHTGLTLAGGNLVACNLIANSLSLAEGWIFTATGNLEFDASTLVKKAIEWRKYPAGHKDGYTVLGCLLEKLIPPVGGDDREFLYELIVKYNLVEPIIDGENVREEIKSKYNISAG